MKPWLGAATLLVSLPGWAQPVPVVPHARLAQCLQVIAGDSVVLFFNGRYELTPAECAVVRRHARMKGKGVLYGPATDYLVASGQLLARVTYANGELHGPYTLFYPNGQPAVSGQHEQGSRRGDWEYWYRSGQIMQQLRFPTDGIPRIMAYWDTTGQALVANGYGVWQGRAQKGLRSVGKVRLGLPEGQWKGYREEGPPVQVAAELYERGRLRKARWREPAQRPVPYFSPLLQPLLLSAAERAVPLRLGYPCDEQARQEQFALLQEHLRIPMVSWGAQRYAERLTQRMVRHSDARWYRALPEKVRVRCSLDATGQFTAFDTDSRALQQVMQRLLTKAMPPWQPATFRGVPVPGYVDVELNTSTRVITVKPAARLSPEQLPDLPVPDLF